MLRLKTLVASILLASSFAGAQTFTIDPAHSNVDFRIKHLIGKVSGRFDKFNGEFNYDEKKPTAWSAQATIDPASINTGIDKRDTHLRSPDFFDVQKFPTMSFKSTGVTGVQGNKGKLNGDLTMHGVTKPVSLDLEIAGTMKDPKGRVYAGATATGVVKRSDFGIGTAGMLGDDVEITLNIEGSQK